MKIGLYKPYVQVYFKENTADHAGWSFEVVNLAKILAKNGHTVDILSDTDLTFFDYANILPAPLSSISSNCKYDRIFAFCGTMNDAVHHDILKCRGLTDRFDLIYTDYKLKPFAYNIFDRIYTQTKNVYAYGALEKLVLFDSKFIEKNAVKDIEFYFGGTERDRLYDIIEYIWRPEVTWHGKSQFFQKNDYISYSENYSLIKRAKYSIVIMDSAYNNVGWVTPRYYENILNDVICFVDNKCDRNNMLVTKHDYRRVGSYFELRDKIKQIDASPLKRESILEKQRQEILPEYLDGSYIYNLLFNVQQRVN